VILRRVVDLQPGEARATLMACACFFLALGSWFILRPIRDEMGVAGGVANLPWLYSGTLALTLLANPLYSALVVRLPVTRVIAIAYRAIIVLVIGFFLLFRLWPQHDVWIGRVFFVTSSVFNLFITAIFWSFMTDHFRSDQGKRLFAFIGVGGTIGAIAGSGLTATLAEHVGRLPLLLVAVAMLEAAVQCVRHFPARSRDPHDRAGETRGREERPIGGSAWASVTHVLRSPYLIGICGFMLLFTIGSTSLYFHQIDLVGKAFQDRAARTAFLARIDVAVQSLTVFLQIFVTARLLRTIGVAATLTILPLASVAGFAALGAAPVLPVLAVFFVLRRALNFGLTGPTREVLFTVLPREDKYKAKSFIDTFVYRGGDQIGAWSYALCLWLGLSQSAIAWAAVPLSAAWLGLAVWLGRKQATLARGREHAGR
jgi:AAA family ATP:ADP antiporter